MMGKKTLSEFKGWHAKSNSENFTNSQEQFVALLSDDDSVLSYHDVTTAMILRIFPA